MRLEKMLLEYDCFPILAIYVENGKRYFCNGTELRTYERIVASPATASQLIRVLTNEATLAGVFGNAETVWVATQEPGSDDFKIEKKSAADLDKYDKLPEGVYASSHPERLAKYVEFLTSVDAEK